MKLPKWWITAAGVTGVLTALGLLILVLGEATTAVPPTEEEVRLKAAEVELKKAQVLQSLDKRSPECPGGVDRFTLTGDEIVEISPHACENRYKLGKDDCVQAYNQWKRPIGLICANGKPIDGTVRYVKAVGKMSDQLLVTRCPEGSPLDPSKTIPLGRCS